MSAFEQYAVRRIIDQATDAGVTIPAELTAYLDCGGGSYAARAWADAHPGDDGTGCCWGEVHGGPAHCICWKPVYADEQQPPRPPAGPQDLAAQTRMCGDCAFRKDSPERADEWSESALMDLAASQPTWSEVVVIPLRDKAGDVKAEAKVDVADASLAEHRWYLDSTGYAVRTQRLGPGRRKKHYLHRAVLGLDVGGPEVDHLNGDKLDCRRSNLRAGSHARNLQNRGANAGRKWARGVSYHYDKGKWSARAKLHGETTHLGYFDSPEAAAKVASQFRAEHMPWSPDAIAAREITPFWCHEGMRRPVRWEHPDGRTVVGSPDDWQPPMVAGVPFRLDGSPGLLCAGWSRRAARAAVDGQGGGDDV